MMPLDLVLVLALFVKVSKNSPFLFHLSVPDMYPAQQWEVTACAALLHNTRFPFVVAVCYMMGVLATPAVLPGFT